jgi:hypothetical protein
VTFIVIPLYPFAVQHCHRNSIPISPSGQLAGYALASQGTRDDQARETFDLDQNTLP